MVADAIAAPSRMLKGEHHNLLDDLIGRGVRVRLGDGRQVLETLQALQLETALSLENEKLIRPMPLRRKASATLPRC